MEQPPFVNMYGRKPGRGVRPWLLIPKVLCVAVYFGSLVSALVLLGMDGGGFYANRILNKVTAPAAWCVFGFGVLLFLQHPIVFWRMRWLRIKLLLIILLVAVHFTVVTGGTNHLPTNSREATFSTSSPETERGQRFVVGLLFTLLLTTGIVIVARLKPRLGQS